MSELLPCPFCGKEPEYFEEGDHHGEFFKLGCPDNECCGHWAFYTEPLENKEKSISLWNNRPNLAEPISEKRTKALEWFEEQINLGKSYASGYGFETDLECEEIKTIRQALKGKE